MYETCIYFLCHISLKHALQGCVRGLNKRKKIFSLHASFFSFAIDSSTALTVLPGSAQGWKNVVLIDGFYIWQFIIRSKWGENTESCVATAALMVCQPLVAAVWWYEDTSSRLQSSRWLSASGADPTSPQSPTELTMPETFFDKTQHSHDFE